MNHAWPIGNGIIPGVRPKEEEDDCVEEERVEGAPERVGHGLDDDPPDDHVVGVEDGAVRHDKAREAARVAAKHHDGRVISEGQLRTLQPLFIRDISCLQSGAVAHRDFILPDLDACSLIADA